MRAVVVSSLLVVSSAGCGPETPSAGTDTEGASATGTTAGSSSTAGGSSTGGGQSTAATTEGSTTGASATGSTSGTTAAGTTTGVETGATTGATTGEALPSCCATPDVRNSSVEGSTPLGPLALTWGFFGIHGGECGGHSVFLVEDPSLLGQEVGPRLEIYVDSSLAMPGTFPAWFTAVDGQGKTAMVEGSVDVVTPSMGPFEPSWCMPGDPVVMTDLTMELSFSIAAEGWDVEGKVVALYCPQLNVFCP